MDDWKIENRQVSLYPGLAERRQALSFLFYLLNVPPLIQCEVERETNTDFLFFFKYRCHQAPRTIEK